VSVSSLVSFNNTKRRVVFLLLVTYATDAIKCMQLNALFCCLWRNLEGSCHKHFFVVSCYQHRRSLPAISVTTCGTVVRRRRIDNTCPVAVLTARSEARYRLKIAITSRHNNFAMAFGKEKLQWPATRRWKNFEDRPISLFVLTEFTNVTDTQTDDTHTYRHRMTT